MTSLIGDTSPLSTVENSVLERFRAARERVEEAEKSRDQAAFTAALYEMGEVLWNLAPQIEAALRAAG